MGDRNLYGVQKFIWGTNIYREYRNELVPNIHHMYFYVSVYVTQLNTEYTYIDIFSGVARVSAAWGGFLICRPSSYP